MGRKKSLNPKDAVVQVVMTKELYNSFTELVEKFKTTNSEAGEMLIKKWVNFNGK